MREDILRILKNIRRRKDKSQCQSVDFDQTFTFSKIREKKGEKILRKLYFQKLERKRRIFMILNIFYDIKVMIFREEVDLL